MFRRLRILGVVLAAVGLAFVAAGAFAFIKTEEGYRSLEAFSAAQNVKLSYNEDGQLISGGETAEAQEIMALLKDDWAYPVNQGDLDPNDPIVNTPTEYMFQMATIAYHTLTSTQTVVLTEPVEYKGVTYEAGTYEFAVDGRYFSDFDRSNPIEGPARAQAWSATAHALIGELGVGTVTGSALQLGLALAGLFAAVGALAFLSGIGLIWAVRGETEPGVEVARRLEPMPA
jgi:hypothetical protein